jgi:hypothetical protein
MDFTEFQLKNFQDCESEQFVFGPKEEIFRNLGQFA